MYKDLVNKKKHQVMWDQFQGMDNWVVTGATKIQALLLGSLGRAENLWTGGPNAPDCEADFGFVFGGVWA